MTETIVCGAGPAGLASAACLKRAGFPVRVLEQGDRVGMTWRRRYDELRLNTLGWMSGLPGYRASRRRYGEFPTRDDWIRYLEDYARHHKIEPEFGIEVERIDPADGGWRVHTSKRSYDAPIVVVAMGFYHDPYVPDWPGRDSFEGKLMHAADYRNAAPFSGLDVLVVGPGNTGSEIATFLANGGAACVRASMRTPPNIFPRKWLGVPMNISALAIDKAPPKLADTMGRLTQKLIYGDLSEHGLPFPPLGVRRSIDERSIAPAVDAGFIEAVKQRRIELLPGIERLERADVVLRDGRRIQPDVVLCATGYRSALDGFVGHLGVLGERGLPRGSPTVEVPEAPGLFFVGYWSRVSGQLRLMRLDARRVARRAKRARRAAERGQDQLSYQLS